jgi:hypothetical protein
MSALPLIRLALLAFGLPALVQAQSAGARDQLAIVDVTVVDVVSGARLPGRTVLVEDGRIRRVDSVAASLPPDARIVRGTGGFLIPGLWDMHTHILHRWEWNAPLAIAAGVTGIRDMATRRPLAEVLRLRDDVAAGRTIAPRILSFAGPLVDGAEPIFEDAISVSVATPARVRIVVDSLADAGATFIKVYTGIPRDLYPALQEAAARRGLRIAGHVPPALTVSEAVDAGFWSLEHAYRHRSACAEAEPGMRVMQDSLRAAERRRDHRQREVLADSLHRLGITTYSASRCQALGRQLASRGTWFVPTLVEMRSRFLPEEPGDAAFDSLFAAPYLRVLPPMMVSRWRDRLAFSAGLREGSAASEEAWLEERRSRAREIETRLMMVRDLHRGGARILAGTDGSDEHPLVVSGYSIHDELTLLVEAGLSPLEALRSATLHAAEALGLRDRHGAVAPGQVADLVLLDADPLLSIRNTRRIRAVVLGGRVLDQPELNHLMEQATVEAARTRRP